jgi:hypothetical protein
VKNRGSNSRISRGGPRCVHGRMNDGYEEARKASELSIGLIINEQTSNV